MSENVIKIREACAPGKIMFYAPGNKAILTIHPDGRLERGDAFATDDEASMAFFDVLSRYFSSWIGEHRQRTERAEASTEESKRHIDTLTSFFMDNVLWVRAAADARAFVRGLERTEAAPRMCAWKPIDDTARDGSLWPVASGHGRTGIAKFSYGEWLYLVEQPVAGLVAAVDPEDMPVLYFDIPDPPSAAEKFTGVSG